MINLLRPRNEKKNLFEQDVYRHVLYKTLKYTDEEFKQKYNDKYVSQNKFKPIYFYQLIDAIGKSEDKFTTSFLGNGTYGYVFKLQLQEKEFCVKFSPYLKYQKEQESFTYDHNKRPENSEHNILQLLYVIFHREYELGNVQQYMVVIPQYSGLIYFDEFISFIQKMEEMQQKEITDQIQLEIFKKTSIYEKIQKQIQKQKIDQQSIKFLICEYCKHGNLQSFFENKLKNMNQYLKNQSKNKKINDQKYLVSYHELNYIYFQILFILYTIQKYYPNFKHNDLKPNNILIQKISQEYLVFKVKNVNYKFKTYGYLVKFWDFDFACIDGFINNIKCQEKWANDSYVDQVPNKYQDIYFFNKNFYYLFNDYIEQMSNQNNKVLEISELYEQLQTLNEKLTTKKNIDSKQNKEKRIPSSVFYKDAEYFITKTKLFSGYIQKEKEKEKENENEK